MLRCSKLYRVIKLGGCSLVHCGEVLVNTSASVPLSVKNSVSEWSHVLIKFSKSILQVDIKHLGQCHDNYLIVVIYNN